MPVSILLDAPPVPDDGAVVSTHPVAKLGSFSDPRYGKWKWTLKDFTEWQRVFAQQGSELVIDYDHQSAGANTKAAGWIKDLTVDGDKLLATIEWTPEGADAVRNRYWRYVSPEIGPVKDEQNRKIGIGLHAVALTNRPFLRKDMPAISLSQDFTGETFAESVSDTPTVPDLTKIAETLKLSADATEDQVLEAIGNLAEPTPEPDTKTLTEQATAEGLKVLTLADFTTLQAQAQAGEDAQKQLAAQTFENAYTKLLTDGKTTTDEDTKTLWREQYDRSPDGTLKLMEKLPVVVKLGGPAGGSGGDATTDHSTFEGENADPDSARLLKQAEKLVADEKITLNQAIDRVMAEAV